MRGVDAVLHAATLHKPHVATHARQDFVDTNVTGTLNLLERRSPRGVRAFVFTSTTSAFGRRADAAAGAPAAWITEDVVPVPKNIYGVTKVAAEDLCELFQRNQRPAVHRAAHVALLSRERRRSDGARDAYADANLKANEFLYRRVDIEDVVDAHLLAIEQAPAARLRPLHHQRHDAVHARRPARAAHATRRRSCARRVPGVRGRMRARGWSMLPGIDRVYVNERARARARLAAAPRLRRA